MKHLLILVAGLWLLAFRSFAIVDTNHNGLSDLWEKAHNNEQLFPATFDPQADDDQDGWSNAEEAAAGTDPSDPNPPDGLVLPATSHIAAVFGPPDANGNPVIDKPECVALTWPTIPGKWYTLLISTDLADESWLPDTTIPPFIGNGNFVTYSFPVTDSSERFWRITIEDLDSDGDTLNDAEEIELGLDPNSSYTDSDTDGMPDHWEILHGLDPFNASDALLDPDQDGLSNAQEYTGGSDPLVYDVVTTLERDWVIVESWVVETTLEDGTKQWTGKWSDDTAASERMAHEEFQHVLEQRDQRPYSGAWWSAGPINDSGIIWLHPDGQQPGNTSSEVVSPPTKTTIRSASKFSLRLTRNIETGPEVREDYMALIFPNVDMSEAPTTLPVELTIPENQRYSQTVELKSDLPHALIGLLPVEIVPDYNRDGKIDQADRGKVSEENPYRFWVNDDDDRSGEKRRQSSNDTPGSRGGSSNGVIDGIRDLIDFFPLYLDLQTALKVLPSTEYKYFLKHSEGALKFHEVVETNLDQNHDNQGPAAYLKNVAKALSLDGLTLKHANSSGVELSAGILGSFGKGEGVLLCEITQQTQTPLILEIRKNDGTSVAEIKFPLKTSGVEDMYRHVNLRPAAGGAGGRATETAEPSNYPDDIPGLTSDKYLVFVHGYNVNGEQARGWHSEFFKRMWWSGSLARFVGVSWHGDESQGGAGMTTSPVRGIIPDDITPNYHANVINAFQTADDLTSSLAWIDGEVSIGAHSLGNMVVGLAIQDHGFQAENYFLVDAAVAMESYNAGETKQANMTNGDWVDYDERLWASKWHQLPWPQNDPRKKLTWRGRLGDVVSRTNAYNFYSSEEEVLNNATASQSSTLLGAASDDLFLDWIIGGNVKGEGTWALQEILKGKGITGEVLGSIYSGWKFNFKFLSWLEDDPPPAEINEIHAALFETFSVPPLSFWKRYNTRQLRPDETSELAGQTQQLMTKPFFDPPPAGKTHAELLAQAFPARTNPAGRNPVGIFDANFDMVTLKNGWFGTDDRERRWLHSDIRDVGYLYTWKVYDKFRELGGLNQ